MRRFVPANVDVAADVMRRGGVIAYPTEAVFGLGCDPQDRDAFERLFALKERPATQGVLLIAASFEQVERYIDRAAVPSAVLDQVLASWPGPNTWVFPRSAAGIGLSAPTRMPTCAQPLRTAASSRLPRPKSSIADATVAFAQSSNVALRPRRSRNAANQMRLVCSHTCPPSAFDAR